MPGMKIGLRTISDQAIQWFSQEVQSGEQSRTGLARGLCEQSNWYNQQGKPCTAQASKILPQLAAKLNISLPTFESYIPQASKPKAYESVPPLRCSLRSLGAISVEPIRHQETDAWYAMMRSCHPQGIPKNPGQAIKYWVVSESHGRLGGLSFHAASWHEAARDRYIGWSPRARVRNLHRVLNNARFLILPRIRVHGLASKALTLVKDRVATDWERVYGIRPLLAYTHVDTAHSGQSYLTSGWRQVGMTSGRRCATGEPKQVLVAPLQRVWRVGLNACPRECFRATQLPGLPDEAHWTEWEYGASTHPDGRIAKRLLAMGQAWDEARGDETPRLFRTPATSKAAYRLLSNRQVSMDDILESHRQSTVLRCSQHPVVLAVQDTTALNFDTLKNATEGLHSIGGTAKGIYAHANVAFSEEGSRVLGVLDIDGEFRNLAKEDAHRKESVRWIEGMELAGELSIACEGTRELLDEEAGLLPTRIVSVCDREGDDWEMFERQHELADQVGLLVRSNGARQRRILCQNGKSAPLREYIESLDPLADKEVTIEAQGGKRARKKRVAKVSLRIARVAMKAPKSKKTAHKSLPMIVVSVKEDRPARNVKSPLNWLLLCTEGEAVAENALRICQWYETRWGIEEYFRVLKSGCEIEKRQFDDTEAMIKCMAFDSITAWRVFDLQRRAKHEGDRLACEIVGAEEIEVSQMLLHSQDMKLPLRAPPDLTIRDYVVGLGKLAGFNPRKNQKIPGTKLLWKGTVKLYAAIVGIRAYKIAQSKSEEWKYE